MNIATNTSKRMPLWAQLYLLLTLAVMVFGFYKAMTAPTEATMGNLYRIFFYHLPHTILSFLFPYLNCAASLPVCSRTGPKSTPNLGSIKARVSAGKGVPLSLLRSRDSKSVRGSILSFWSEGSRFHPSVLMASSFAMLPRRMPVPPRIAIPH